MKKIPPWQVTLEKQHERQRLVAAVVAVLKGNAWFLGREENERLLSDLANALPTLVLIRELDKARAADKPRRAPPTPVAKTKHATPAKKKPARTIAKPKRAKPARRVAPKTPQTNGRPRGKADQAIAGRLEADALDLASSSGSVTAGDLLEGTPGATRNQVSGALARLVTRGRLVQTGKGRHTKYSLANGAGAKTKQTPILDDGETAASF